jgi:hypothetical protein
LLPLFYNDETIHCSSKAGELNFRASDIRRGKKPDYDMS